MCAAQVVRGKDTSMDLQPTALSVSRSYGQQGVGPADKHAAYLSGLTPVKPSPGSWDVRLWVPRRSWGAVDVGNGHISSRPCFWCWDTPEREIYVRRVTGNVSTHKAGSSGDLPVQGPEQRAWPTGTASCRKAVCPRWVVVSVDVGDTQSRCQLLPDECRAIP